MNTTELNKAIIGEMFKPAYGGLYYQDLIFEITDTTIRLAHRNGNITSAPYYRYKPTPSEASTNELFMQHYEPSFDQLWEKILEFNEEQGFIDVIHETIYKKFWLCKSRGILDEFYYTDIASMKLALVKVCCQIHKIHKEAK